MNRIEFIEQLEYLLQDISNEEKADAIAYYQDYLEEAGDEEEARVINEFGSPERVAAIIRSELAGNLEDGGGFTESGYQDERFKDPRYQVIEHRDLPECQEKIPSQKSSEKKWWKSWQEDTLLVKCLKLSALILVLICVIPMLLGAGSAVATAVVGILVTVLSIALLVGLGTIALCVAAVIILVLGIGTIVTNPWSGLLLLGMGVLLLGLSFLGIVLSVLIYGYMIPCCIRGTIEWISRILHREKRRSA